MTKIIDSTNLGYLISKIKAAFWGKSETTQISIDDTPTASSNNLVKSGGIKTYVDNATANIPTISTDINADAASDVKAASPKAVKTYVDNHASASAVSDVTVGGTSVVSNGVAVVPAIPIVPDISTNIATDASSDTKTASPKAVKTYVDAHVTNIAAVSAPNPADGTLLITLTSGDTITVDLNHDHTSYPKYVLCADEAAYNAIANKDNSTLYLIPETSS